MINFLRRMMDSWLAVALLTLVLAAFVITGFSSFTRSGGGNSLGKVGHQQLGATDFAEQAQQRLKMIQQKQPTATMGEFAKAGGLEQVFEGLIQRATIRQVMDDLGIVSGNLQKGAAMSSIEAFRIGDQFSRQKYEQTLAQNKMTTKKFETTLEEELAREQLVGAMSRGWEMPKSALMAYASLIEEKRTATIAYVSAAGQPNATVPTEQILNDYYKKNIKNYMAAETRSFRYFIVSPETVAPTIVVSDAELQKYFDDNKADYGGVELRRVSQVLLDSDAAAKEVSAAGGTAQGFLAAAQKAVPGLTAEDLTLGDVAEKDIEKDAGKAAAATVFGLKSGTVTPPISTDRGWLVYRVDGVTPAKVAKLAAVRPQIEVKVRTEKSINALYDLTKKLEDATGKRQSIEELAKIAKSTIDTIKAADKQGRMPDGSAAPVVPAVLRLAFEKDANEDLTVEDVDRAVNSFAVVETTAVNLAAPRPFADVRAMVTNAWLRETLNARAKAQAAALAAAAKSGKDLTLAAKAMNVPVKAGASGSRLAVLQSGRPLSAMEQKIFSLRKGEADIAPAPNGDGFFVVQVTDAAPTPVNEQSQSYQLLQRSSTEMGGLEGLQQFVVASRKMYGEKFNQAAVAAVKNQIAGVRQDTAN
jgi:peptidyl-prolyl cis-trans isomerase D